MKKITLKIVDKIAKNYNTSLCELFAIFLANIISDIDYKIIAKKYNFKENEIKEFFNYLKEIEYFDEFIENFLDVCKDYDKLAENLALFFSVFIPSDVLFSQDAIKIKESLKRYPDEIKDAILKSLELLSAVKLVDENTKKGILTEIIKIMLILSKLKDINDT